MSLHHVMVLVIVASVTVGGSPGVRADRLPTIMVTGYWDPTGRMIRHFSQDQELNPDGWQGENWEGRGYDIVSFFPDPDNEYQGDFEVDYQDTLWDFWWFVVQVEPTAIVSFGAGNGPWEIEFNARNITNWIDDYEVPFQPEPNPPDDTSPVGFERHASLPIVEIADRVNQLNLPGIGNTGAWIDWTGNPGRFLCEYMAYHVMWYQSLYPPGTLTHTCYMAGFIHVAYSSVPVESGRLATEETLRAVIEALDNPLPTPTATPTATWTPPAPTMTPTQEPTPSPQPSATATIEPTLPATPTPAIGPILSLNQDFFTPNDQFILTCQCANDTPQHLAVDLYLFLDFEGYYWFWPEWTQDLQSAALTIPANGFPPVALLEFLWPEGAGEADDLRFWAAYLEQGTLTLLGDISVVEFGFGVD